MEEITILGAGLAGSEAAYQLAKRGFRLRLIDMKPAKRSPAHTDPNFGELVCSNSLRSEKLSTATGLLKQELKCFDSLVMQAAEACRLPAGNALAVDRQAFPQFITETLKSFPEIRFVEQQIDSLEELGEGYRIVATGPLTAGSLFSSIENFTGHGKLFFFDAAAPLIEDQSIDKSIAYRKNRYTSGDGDYLNCPLNKEDYLSFYEALLKAERVSPAGFEKSLLFDGCKPVEEIALEGEDTLRFGPLKPVGLEHPETGQEFYAVVQLRQDNFAQNLWNMVGFQTRLKFPEQERVFRMIPGLAGASFARHGVMHRNSFISSPEVLQDFYRSKKDKKLFFAGQITGVEGYLESASSGLLAALAIAKDLGEELDISRLATRTTVMGGLQAYVSQSEVENFQPLKANFSLLSELSKEERRTYQKEYNLNLRGRTLRRSLYALRSLESLGLSKAAICKLWQEER